MGAQLEGKVVLVTGSSIGIGRATAIRFAEEGCRVVVTYLEDEREAEETAVNCRDIGAPEVLITELDVRDDISIMRAVGKVLDKHGKLDILINNAGVITWKPLKEQTLGEIEDQLRTDLEGTVKMTRACLPYLTDMVVGMTSVTALKGYGTVAPYSASKAGIIAFFRSLAEETDIPVFAVMPGETATRMTDYEGEPPENVAEVVVNLAKGRYAILSGEVVKVFDPPPAVGREGEMQTVRSELSR